ncbi:hypothetical protein LINGRAPRIM_LOCUS2314 [Linum grandiflorum]
MLDRKELELSKHLQEISTRNDQVEEICNLLLTLSIDMAFGYLIRVDLYFYRQ